MAADPDHTPGKNILFLDGDCLFCRRSARWLHRFDHRKHLFFAPLQGETAAMLPGDQKILIDQKGQPSGSAVLLENAGYPDQQIWTGADAVLRAFLLTGSVIAALWILHYLPAFVKSGVYQFIARNRHQLRPAQDHCPLDQTEFKDQLMP